MHEKEASSLTSHIRPTSPPNMLLKPSHCRKRRQAAPASSQRHPKWEAEAPVSCGRAGPPQPTTTGTQPGLCSTLCFMVQLSICPIIREQPISPGCPSSLQSPPWSPSAWLASLSSGKRKLLICTFSPYMPALRDDFHVLEGCTQSKNCFEGWETLRVGFPTPLIIPGSPIQTAYPHAWLLP